MSKNEKSTPENNTTRNKARFFTSKASKLLDSLVSFIEQVYPFAPRDKQKNPRLRDTFDAVPESPEEIKELPSSSKSNDFNDRREALRVCPDLICVVLVLPDEENERACGDLLDVSVKGFSAEFGKSLGIGKHMMFSLVFEWNRTVDVSGVVVYERMFSNGSCRCGVNFVFRDSQNEKSVREWIMEHQRYLQRKRAYQKSRQESSS